MNSYKNKYILCICISCAFGLFAYAISYFTEAVTNNILLKLLILDGFFIPLFIALKLYKESIPEEKLLREVVITFILICFAFAILYSHIYVVVLLIK